MAQARALLTEITPYCIIALPETTIFLFSSAARHHQYTVHVPLSKGLPANHIASSCSHLMIHSVRTRTVADESKTSEPPIILPTKLFPSSHTFQQHPKTRTYPSLSAVTMTSPLVLKLGDAALKWSASLGTCFGANTAAVNVPLS
ncbi:unnamed protein product [Chondrus crispus]|uniref:Uncharacterized protein n=1 Tax=Chondrus crispus TaxID=2769 RepID=R7QU91_CHOCR|nr:unnamed protein product [Chondrus crispus]CDF41036.1 unnamed protein product [Chondrus crispus]|eukprot:XP_005711330.1 unnamed protein product [Chondrus crispus]